MMHFYIFLEILLESYFVAVYNINLIVVDELHNIMARQYLFETVESGNIVIYIISATTYVKMLPFIKR